MRHLNNAAGHILSFAQTLQGGGVERALLRMAKGWRDHGRRVTLVIGDATGALAHELPEGVDVHILDDRRYRALLDMKDIVRAAAPDVIFCPGNHYTGAAYRLRRQLGAACPPMAAQVSNALHRPDLNPLIRMGYNAWLRIHPRFLDVIVAMSPAMGREAVEMMQIAPNRVHVIPNPPTEKIIGAPPPPMPEGRFILGVGRLAKQKRWERLIAALPLIADQEIKLMILGEGGERAQLEALVAKLGLGERVWMPGHAPDPLPAIERATVMVLTSDFEGVPGVMREAIALGTPVIATNSSVAIPEYIDTVDRGSLIPVNDTPKLVAALNHWLTPGRARPEPRQEAGGDPNALYLDLFDRMVAERAGIRA